jgi:hypothetical protein
MVNWNNVFVFPHFVEEALDDTDTHVPYESVVSLENDVWLRRRKKKKTILDESPQKTQEQRLFWSSSIPHPLMQ